TFAARPSLPCPLTLSHSVLLRLLDAEQPRSVPTESQTNIGDAIAWGLHSLPSAAGRRQVLILLSDGEHNVPPPALKPRQAAQLERQIFQSFQYRRYYEGYPCLGLVALLLFVTVHVLEMTLWQRVP